MRTMNIPVIILALSSIAISSPTSREPVLVVRDATSDCKGGAYSGRYTDNQGTYMTSDTVTHPYRSPRIRKCWQDYFAVDNTIWSVLP